MVSAILLARVDRAKQHPPEERLEHATGSAPELSGPLLAGIAPDRLERFAEAARKSGVHAILLCLVDQVFAVTASGPPGATTIDAAAPDLLAQLDRHGMLGDPSTASQWRSHAQQAAGLGIARREHGDLAEAYIHQRFALFVALRQQSIEGVLAIVGNIWILRESVRDITERAQGPARGHDGPRDASSLGELLEKTLAFMQHDALFVKGAVRELADASAEDPPQCLAMHHTCYRLARIAGDDPMRSAELDALVALAESLGDARTAVIVAAEEVAQMDLLDALRASGMMGTSDLPPSDTADAWPRYRKLRSHIHEVGDLGKVAAACGGAFNHLCHLRLRATTAGGAFGHQLSYAISSVLQTVGRDLVGLLHRMGRNDDALSVAEMLLARSMADWMARTHGIWAIPSEFRAGIGGLNGSINAVAAAGLADIHAAVRAVDAPLLYYLQQEDSYLAWLVRKDERVVTVPIADPAPHVAYLLPSIASAEREALDPEHAREQEEAISLELRALYDTLFPAPLHEALADQGKRLVIVADAAIQSVPFCALRTPDTHYLIDERELVFWPSVTSWLTLESSAHLTSAARARIGAPRKPLVIGISSFDREYSIHGPEGDYGVKFDELPNATREAKDVAAELGTAAVLGGDASIAALLEGGRGTEIIHIATHAHLDEAHPRQSFLALADGTVTADALYRQDQGVQTSLVVLSACDTALGGGHADSVIGLANAFLIAGARSVVSTLWPIADDATPIFMSAFYGAIKEGKDLATALRHAQRALLANPDTSDPYFWAPFVLTGRVANPLAPPA